MIPVGKLLLAAFSSVAAFGIWKFFQFVYLQLMSPICHLRGPKAAGWIQGNMRDVWDTDNPGITEEWVKQYGSTLKYKGPFGRDQLFTMDMRAINYVFSHSSDFYRPSHARYGISQLFGKGVIYSEGAVHRQQRRILNPAFGPAEIRAVHDVFLTAAVRLRDVFSFEIARDPVGTTSGARIDVMSWLTRAALDIICLAGFNHDINALDTSEKPNELRDTFATIFGVGEGMTLFPNLQAWIPILRLIPTSRASRLAALRQAMFRFGRGLLSNGKVAAQTNATERGEVGKNSFRDRSLLSVLMKANMAADLPKDQRLSDQDVLDQVATFLVTGHESTGIALTWALYSMTKAPEIQKKLREELLLVETENPSMDELMALPYLDAVVRETLRMHPPVTNSNRIAMKDDVIPIEKPCVDKNGVVLDSIRVRKGDQITIPILAINRSRELWGSDSHEFKPERWQNVPDAAAHIPGVWGNQLTFLAGPRACIGWRFSLVEMKTILFTLLREFEFELAIPTSEIVKKLAVVPVQRPVLVGDPTNKAQLPLLVKPYKRW